MEKIITFLRCIIAISMGGSILLIKGSQLLFDKMDGDFFDDNMTEFEFKKINNPPGVYTCDVEFWFEQGFFEGYPHPGENDWVFKIKNIKPICIQED